jgi:hypothetical protein
MIIIQVNKLENAHMEVKTAFLPISIGQPYGLGIHNIVIFQFSVNSVDLTSKRICQA